MNTRSQPAFFSAQISEAKRFYLDCKPSRDVPLAVVCGGCEHCAPDYEIHRRSFPYWSIEFVARGKGSLRLHGRTYPLTAGTIFSYGPRIPHDIVSHPRQTLVKYFVDFTGKEARALLERHAPGAGRVVHTSAAGEIFALFEDLLRNGLRDTPFTPRLAALLVEQLVLKIAETVIPMGATTSPAFATYQRCRQYLEARWSLLPTLGQAARECHVDAAYLCRLFRRFDHQSPYQFLLRLKMNHAAGRLLAGAPSKQIADELGFSDPFHFSRVFKAVMSVSPSQFAPLSHRKGKEVNPEQ